MNVQIFEQITQIPADTWNACVSNDNPFARHEFLRCLEESGSACARTGWLGQYFVLYDDQKTVRACLPAYLKNHSYGEYIFDWSWADAFERAGGRYYPKLQVAIPFTPATGQRLLLKNPHDVDAQNILLQALVHHAEELGLSSIHMTFCEEAEAQRAQSFQFMPRVGHQYHWENKNYAHFDDFLAKFSSRKRKNLKKERQKIRDAGVKFDVLKGHQITDDQWSEFYQLYQNTINKKWAQAYLTPEFFPLLSKYMPENTVLIRAHYDGQTLGAALNIQGSNTLFGRYWGCHADYQYLHFETCYYQAIEYAIHHKLGRVEAGAQGTHKIQRGYLPTPTYSAHWIAHPGLKSAIASFLEQDLAINHAQMNALAQQSPFKQMD